MTEHEYLGNPPAIFPANEGENEMSATHPINFDPHTRQIVDVKPGDLYVRPEGGVVYGVAAKVEGQSDAPVVTLALAGTDGIDKSVKVSNASPQGWKRAIDQSAPVGSLQHLVRGFVPRATEINNLKEANFARAIRAENALDTFKDEVKRVALEYGQRYDMCEKLSEALSELGIELNVEVEVTGTFSVTMSVPWGEHDSIDESDVLEALSNEYDPFPNGFSTEIVSE